MMKNNDTQRTPGNINPGVAAVEADKFLCLQNEEFQKLYNIFCQEILKNNSKDSICKVIAAHLQETYEYDNLESLKIAKIIYGTFIDPNFNTQFYDSPITINLLTNEISPAQEPQIIISSIDYQRYVEMISADPEANDEVKSLLLAFVIFYRKNFHPRGWSRYDKKGIFYLAGINKFPIYEQEKLTKYLHTHYNLNMQVVGSNQPMTCFNFSWLYDQPEVGTEFNPLINLGPLKPATIKSIVSKIKI